MKYGHSGNSYDLPLYHYHFHGMQRFPTDHISEKSERDGGNFRLKNSRRKRAGII